MECLIEKTSKLLFFYVEIKTKITFWKLQFYHHFLGFFSGKSRLVDFCVCFSGFGFQCPVLVYLEFCELLFLRVAFCVHYISQPGKHAIIFYFVLCFSSRMNVKVGQLSLRF